MNSIDKRISELDPDTYRAQILRAVRAFRSSWVDLGRMLTDVAFGGDYKEWGYQDFSDYCRQELGIKATTVKKLMVSYNYLKNHEPQRLTMHEEAMRADDRPSIPDFQTVELLHRARQRDDIIDQADSHHERAFNDPGDETELRKEIKADMRGTKPERSELSLVLKGARLVRKKAQATGDVPSTVMDDLESFINRLEHIVAAQASS